ncbi:unnamed protein product [Clavelina lepadiformis]|uniref:Uncharacterized protein n=1 Tax=Clavelina lepadiformis TaxID=159417 RepID=A0ABP0FP95_CLALP
MTSICLWGGCCHNIFQNYLAQMTTSVWMLMPPGKCLKNYEMKLITLTRLRTIPLNFDHIDHSNTRCHH